MPRKLPRASVASEMIIAKKKFEELIRSSSVLYYTSYTDQISMVASVITTGLPTSMDAAPPLLT